MIRDLASEFAQNEIAPKAEYYDQRAEFPYDIVNKLADLGFMGLPVPEEYGGAGADTLTYAVAAEQIARGDASVGITMAAHTSLGIMPFLMFGTDEQKQKYVPPLAAGQQMWSFGLTEPNAGSDAGSTRTQAVEREGEWVINGVKAFITNSGTDISAGVTITAVTGNDASGQAEISNIIVPTGTPGYTVSKDYHKMGWRASDTHELSFNDARVPNENVLGQPGQGFRQFLKVLDGGRISVAAITVGLAQAAYDAAFKYAQERSQFGQPISKFQAIQFKLADMATEIELARLMTYKAAWLKDQGRDFRIAAGMAKLYAGDAANRACNQAIKIHGGYGVMEEFPVARYWRDVQIHEIGEGTPEVQRMVISRLLGM